MLNDNSTIILPLIAVIIGTLIRCLVKGNLVKIISNALGLVFSGYSLNYGYVENNPYCYALSALIFGAVIYDLYTREKKYRK